MSFEIGKEGAYSVRVIEHESEDFIEAVGLRYEILRRPLGLDFTDDELKSESKSFHIGLYGTRGCSPTLCCHLKVLET